jgi:hypothetical protein
MATTESKTGLLFVRIVIGLAVGAVVASISIYIAWYNNVVEQYNDLLCREQIWTRSRLDWLDEVVKEYQRKSNSLPQSLEQAINASTNAIPNAGSAMDAWHHPLQYTVTGSNYLIVSYGEDGLPGGEGVNCDLTNRNPRPKERKMTFLQFLKAPAARAMINCSLICGFAAALICASTVKKTQLTDRTIKSMVLRLFFTTMGATIIAIFITAIHVPSGH